MKKYYLMAIEKGNIWATLTLIQYFKDINDNNSLVKLYNKLNMKNELVQELSNELKYDQEILDIILNLNDEYLNEFDL